MVLALALLLSACGDSPESSDTDAAADCTVTASEQPTIAEPDLSDDPPSELQVEALASPPSPDCPEAEAGDFVAVDYVGRSYSTGEVFDSSEGRDPFTFQLGAGQVIPGWDQGIAGLQVGERARLIIPPKLGYGEAGAGGGVIAPHETLVFDVQLVDILEPADQTGSASDG